MARFLILVSIAVIFAYVDMKILLGFLAGLAYYVACDIIDDRNDKGDC